VKNDATFNKRANLNLVATWFGCNFQNFLKIFHNGAKALSRVKGINGLVSLSHTIEAVGDEVVHGQFSAHALVYQHGNVSARLESTKRSSWSWSSEINRFKFHRCEYPRKRAIAATEQTQVNNESVRTFPHTARD